MGHHLAQLDHISKNNGFILSISSKSPKEKKSAQWHCSTLPPPWDIVADIEWDITNLVGG